MIQPFDGVWGGSPSGVRGRAPRRKFERFVGENGDFLTESTHNQARTLLWLKVLSSSAGLEPSQPTQQHPPSPAFGSDVIVHGASHRELCWRLQWWRRTDHGGTAARAANLFQLWRRRRGRRHCKVDGAQLRRIDDEATAVRWGPLFEGQPTRVTRHAVKVATDSDEEVAYAAARRWPSPS